MAQELSENYRKLLIGSVQSVLFEEQEGALYTGHAPNYIKVYAEGAQLHNRILPVQITGIFRDGVLGTVVEA